MKKENVIAIRDTYKNSGGFGVEVIMDNMQLLNSKNHFIFWDDTDELIIGVRLNNSQFRNEAPMEIIVSEYEHIQYILSYVPANDFNAKISAILKGINTEITDEQIKHITDFYDNEITVKAIVPNKDFGRHTNPMSQDAIKPNVYNLTNKWVKVAYISDNNVTLFEQNVLCTIDEYSYSPAARNQADMYAMSVGRHFDKWDKTEEEVLDAIRQAEPSEVSSMGLVVVKASFKL